MQLNASPRTDGAGDTQLQSTLPTMSQASSTAPLTATKPLLLRAWLQAPFPPSSSMPCSLLLSSTLQIRSLRPAPVYTGKTRSRFIAALKKPNKTPPKTPNSQGFFLFPSAPKMNGFRGKTAIRLPVWHAYVMGLCPSPAITHPPYSQESPEPVQPPSEWPRSKEAQQAPLQSKSTFCLASGFPVF